jgi:hypothetical protein
MPSIPASSGYEPRGLIRWRTMTVIRTRFNSCQIRSRSLNLPDCFKQSDTGCGGEIQASLPCNLRNPKTLLRLLCKDRLGQARSLASEHQPVPSRKRCAPVRLSPFAGEVPSLPRRAGSCALESRIIVVQCQLQSRPVVHSATPQVSIAQHKPQRAHQVQPRPGCHAQSPDVPRVGRDLRLHQNQVQRMRPKLDGVRHGSLTRQ